MAKRVLIVDDEWRTLQGEAERVSRCGLDVTVVGLAENAARALELVRSERPDIILCDIHMPDMDGIAFTIQAKELDPNLSVIFISGYSDKEYLRTAIRIGAVDYLFKPVDDAEFLAAMQRAIERNDQARVRRQENPGLIDQSLLSTLLHSNDASLLGELVPQAQGNYVVLYAAHNGLYLTGTARQQINMFALHMISSFSQAQHLRYTALREEEGIIFLLGLDSPAGIPQPSVQAMCEAMFEGLPEARGLLSIGIGNHFQWLTQTSRGFAEAVEAHRLAFFRGTGSVIRYESQSPLRYEVREEQIERIVQSIEKSRMLAARDQVDDILMRMRGAEATPIADILSFGERVVDALDVVYVRHLPGKSLFQHGQRAQWAAEITTLSALQKKLQAIFTRVADDTLLGSGGQNAVYNARHYIWANVGGDLSIKAIAAHVYLSPTYFCALFKSISGETVNQYIQHVRIERAKRLLEDNALSVLDIAKAVGYQNSRYFAKVFTAETGQQPSAYRKRLRND